MAERSARAAWIPDRPAHDWGEVMGKLAGYGFTKVFPCLCTGGPAYYESQVLPRISAPVGMVSHS